MRRSRRLASQALALPADWIERWSLHEKRLPAFNPERSHRDVGALMGQAFRRAGQPQFRCLAQG
ncbi:MAG: hypothetical protein EA413_02980 [Cyanobium sp. PLM2.Bin73]|nr:MAG: hypothetical protein EA413_02980 [Cyanobium sp. PLM2.Bin73]